MSRCGLSVLPGQWRPHYRWEHIAWVRPPWPGEDYLWLDFPETIWLGERVHFLSHVNPRFPAPFEDLPRIEWARRDGGLAFERTLPDGLEMRCRLEAAREDVLSMRIELHNGTGGPLRQVRFQTCAFLRAIKEFAAFTNENKFLRVPGRGWTSLQEALRLGPVPGATVSIGWGWGPKTADLPVLATVSQQAERLVAMTWYGSTCTLVGNPDHPCMHADPYMPDLEPGESAAVEGELFFFEGPLERFEAYFLERSAARGAW